MECLYKRYVGDSDIEQLYRGIGKRIRIEREAAQLSQYKLAQLIGVKRPSLTLMEAGRQRIQVHTIYAIATVLDIPMGALLIDYQ